MTAPQVLILYNHPLLPEDHPDADSEHSIVHIADGMGETLKDADFRVNMLGLKQDPTVLWTELKRRKPDVVFNLFEGNLDDTETESYVAGLLQWSGVPFTGSPLATLSLARAKHQTKMMLRGANLPTADFFAVEQLPVPECQLGWPVIVKPAKHDASVGLDQESVCLDQYHLEQRVTYLLETYGGPVLVEEYIRGREFNVALLELPTLECLPVAEIVFPEERPGYWPILTYDGKWRPGTPDYETTPPKYPAEISPRLSEKFWDIARRAYRLLGCRDYARVDFRMKANGRPYILEVNPNPEISTYAGFANCLSSANIPHEEFIVRLIRQALSRRDTPRPTLAADRTTPEAEATAP
jgi:D-alanine-D-alanine ligase